MIVLKGAGAGAGMWFLNPEPGVITLIAGKPATGKTSLLLFMARNFENPCLIDTEGISLKRVKQTKAEHVKIGRVYSFEQQHKAITNFHEKCDFLGVDSLVMLYRLKLAENMEKANAMLAGEMAKLNEIADSKNIPVVVTGHIYTKEGRMRIVSGDIGLYWAKVVILLEKEGPGVRRAKLLKHPWIKEGKEIKFRLSDRGIEI